MKVVTKQKTIMEKRYITEDGKSFEFEAHAREHEIIMQATKLKNIPVKKINIPYANMYGIFYNVKNKKEFEDVYKYFELKKCDVSRKKTDLASATYPLWIGTVFSDSIRIALKADDFIEDAEKEIDKIRNSFVAESEE